MRIDLFDFLQGLVRGTVIFIYNVIATSLAILAHPCRGPWHCHVRSRRADRKQIDGITFLFVQLLTTSLFIAAVLNGNMRAIPADFAQTVARVPVLDSRDLWPGIVAALVGTIIIDGGLRLVTLTSRKLSPGKRAAIVAATDFALLFVVTAICLPTVLFILVSMSDRQLALFWYFWLALVFFSALPASWILRLGIGRGSRSHLRLNTLAMPFVMAGLLLLTGLGLWGGYWSGDWIRKATNVDNSAPHNLTITTLGCQRIANGRIDVEGLLEANFDESVWVDQNQLRLGFESAGSLPPDELKPGLKMALERLQRSGPDRFILVTKSGPRLVHFETARAVSFDPASTNCQLFLGEVVSHGSAAIERS